MLELYYDEYKTFRNINHLNDELERGFEWEMVGVSWVDVEVIDAEDGTTKTYHNPIMLVGRRFDDDRTGPKST